MLVIAACGGEITDNGQDGGADTGLAGDGSGTDAGYTQCVAPNDDSLCGGQCSDVCASGFPCLKDTQEVLGLCPRKGAHLGGDCTRCADGYLCTDRTTLTDPAGAYCADEEYGVLLAMNGKSDWVRYSDRAAYTGAPIPPPPTTCPDVPGLHLCGGACGDCPSGWFCIGRSPMHPISLCFPPGANSQGPYSCSKPGPCDIIGQHCFTFKVDSASQAIADANGLCVTDAQCPLAAQYPGGGSCQ